MARSHKTAHFSRGDGKVFPVDLPLPEAIAEQVAKGHLRAEVAPDAGDPEPAPDAGDPAEPKRPAVNADKAVWVAYAIAVDDTLTEADAAAVTKAELIERYGAR